MYIDACYYFERYHSDQCAKSVELLDSNAVWLLKHRGESATKEYLKDEILTRVVGFGWGDFKCAWSSSKEVSVGTVATLQAHARKVIEAEADRTIPAEAHCAVLQRKTLPQLGQPTIKVEQLDSRSSDDVDSLKAAAAEERARREANGIGDSVQNRQPVQPPPFDDSLVGKHLEVRCKVDVMDPVTERLTGETDWVWWACEVLRVSDGHVAKIGARGHALKAVHPAGHVLLRWEANAKMGECEVSESWMGLLPSKWNCDLVNSWRRDPDYGPWS